MGQKICVNGRVGAAKRGGKIFCQRSDKKMLAARLIRNISVSRKQALAVIISYNDLVFEKEVKTAYVPRGKR